MKSRAECPICESIVTFDPIQTRIKCGQCHQFFAPENATPIEVDSSSKPTTGAVTLPSPTSSVARNPAPPAPAPAASSSTQLQPAKDAEFSVGSERNEDFLFRQYKERQRRAVWRGVQFVLFTIVLAGLVGAGVYAKLHFDTRNIKISEWKPERKATAASRPVAKNQPGPTQETEKKSTPSTDKQEPKQKNAQEEISRSFAPEKFTYFPKLVVQESWAKLYPSIFELKIQRGDEENSIPGTLIDPRGWVVTSYSAIKNADGVLARISPSSADYNFDPRSLGDVAKGILAFDEETDLAIIQVNRKIVDVLKTVELLEKPPVVGNFSLIVMPPNSSKSSWMNEAKISFENYSISMSAAITKMIEAAKLKPERSWQVHEASLTVCPGAPVFTEECQLIGVATSASEGTKAVVASASEIAALIKRVAEAPMPFKEQGAAPTVNFPELKEDNERFEISRALNKSGEACMAFNWKPENPGHMSELVSFFKRHVAVSNALRFERVRLADQITLDNQLEYWRRESSSLYEDVSPEQIQAVHDLSGLSKGDSVPATSCLAYVEIVHAATLGDTTHYAHVIGSSLHLAFEANPSQIIPTIGTRWLLVCDSLDPNSKTINFTDSKIDNTHAAIVSAGLKLVEKTAPSDEMNSDKQDK